MLSIRTQDRMTLVPYDKTIVVRQFNDGWWLYCGNKSQYASTEELIAVSCIFLGKYATKERALEVLDEIQNKILSSRKMFVDTMHHSFELDYQLVYQMPLE